MAEKSYKDTLNLPKTDFPMAANLTQMEPRIRDKWEKDKLYEKIQAARKGAPLWVLHDGPPYANGDVHVGTGQNKVLKDIVVKFRTMQGFASPYIPGWDCHGLPIEHKVVKELGPKARDMSKADIRKLCMDFARKYIDIQRKQFKSLGSSATGRSPTSRSIPSTSWASSRSSSSSGRRATSRSGAGPSTGASTTAPRSPKPSWNTRARSRRRSTSRSR